MNVRQVVPPDLLLVPRAEVALEGVVRGEGDAFGCGQVGFMLMGPLQK